MSHVNIFICFYSRDYWKLLKLFEVILPMRTNNNNSRNILQEYLHIVRKQTEILPYNKI